MTEIGLVLRPQRDLPRAPLHPTRLTLARVVPFEGQDALCLRWEFQTSEGYPVAYVTGTNLGGRRIGLVLRAFGLTPRECGELDPGILCGQSLGAKLRQDTSPEQGCPKFGADELMALEAARLAA